LKVPINGVQLRMAVAVKCWS